MNVPFLNLAAQYEALKGELLPVVEKTLASGHYVLGTKFGIGVNSGSDALTLALRALDIGPGDEVITTPFTYIAPAESIHQVGAKIVFADIHPRTFNIDPEQIARRVTPRTRAIIPVHLFGQAAPLDEIFAIARPRGIHVVEDCAQAIGATYQGQPAGSFGAFGCFSFYPTKNLGADGDGGMLVTQDEALAKKVKMLRVHGIERRYFHDLHGYNSRLDELQAAILRVKLPHLKRWNARRAEIARYYTQGLDHLPLEFPVTAKENNHVFHVYALLAEHRDGLQKFMADKGVPTIIYYPQPLHLQKVYADLGYRAGDFPVAEEVSKRILPLPMYPELTKDHLDQVIGSILGYFAQA
jgi:dTDP-4-amino-4,6-dideoxygalactose transaminase